MAGGGVDDTGPLLDRQIVRHLRAVRSYLVEGGRARRFRQAGAAGRQRQIGNWVVVEAASVGV